MSENVQNCVLLDFVGVMHYKCHVTVPLSFSPVSYEDGVMCMCASVE